MITAEKSINIDAPIEKVFDVVSDFESYPSFQPEFESAKVIKRTAKAATVAFTMNLIQRMNYTLKFNLKGPTSIVWEFVEGDSLFKDNSGEWRLKSLGPKSTRAAYRICVELSLWIPASIVQSLLDEQLPKMLERFKAKIEKQ